MSLLPPNVNRADSVNVLLVDDRPEGLLLLAHMLKNMALSLHTASSGAEALRVMETQDFALVLLDVSMPDMDGFETAERLRRGSRGAFTPIIFVTAGLWDDEQTRRGYAVGAVDFLYKPLHADVVRAKVSVFVQLYRQREQIRQQSELLRERAEQERELLMVRAEAALSAREAEYEATARQAPFGVAIVARGGAWVRVNPHLCAMLGYSTHDLPPLSQLLHPNQPEADARAMEQVLAGAVESFRAEAQLQHHNGATVWVSLALSRLNEAGDSRIAVVMEDITERKWQEKCQRFLNSASKTLLSSLDYHKSLPEVVRMAVPLFADWCAIDVVSPDGREVHELVLFHRDPARLEDVRLLRRALWWDARLGGPRLPDNGPALVSKVTANWVAWQPNPNAPLPTHLPSSWVAVPMNTHGHTLGAVTFATESPCRHYQAADLLTAEDFANRCAFAIENARLYEQAQAAVRARDEFLSVASHELRTPLTPLRMQLQRLIGSRHRAPANLPPERVRDILQRSERHVQRLSALIDNLLDVSRIASGRLILDLAPVDLAEVLREVTGRFSEELSVAGSKLTLTIDTDGPIEGQWDRLRVEQVVINLLTNAIKYGGGKPIEASLQLHEGVVTLTFRDHGIGIAADKLSHIFERFERAVPARVYGGLGLGLFIARQILMAHGGSITVHSEEGKGSTFTVMLPQECASVHGYYEDATPTSSCAS